MHANAYLREGYNLAFSAGNKRFIFVPLSCQLVLLVVALASGIRFFETNMDTLVAWLPSWLAWLSWLIEPLFVIALLLLFAITFSFVANLIAAPFYGLLSENIVKRKRPDLINGETTLKEGLSIAGKAIIREFAKLNYYLPRALGLWLLGFFIPGVNFVIWFIFNSWMMTVQYLDYPVDNSGKPFKAVLSLASAHRSFSFGFGSIVQLFSLIPLLNLLVMPIAVCGATSFWCDQQQSGLGGANKRGIKKPA